MILCIVGNINRVCYEQITRVCYEQITRVLMNSIVMQGCVVVTQCPSRWYPTAVVRHRYLPQHFKSIPRGDVAVMGGRVTGGVSSGGGG